MRTTRLQTCATLALLVAAFALLCPAVLSQSWNKWHLGPIGAMGEVEKDTNHFRILEVTKGCPGDAAGLRVGDLIHGVNKEEFDVTTFRHQDGGLGPLEALGWAIDDVEGKDGILELMIRRGDEDKQASSKQKSKKTIKVELKTIGSFSPTYPYNCTKSTAFIDQCLDNLVRKGVKCRTTTMSLIGLAMLARGTKEFQPKIKQIRNALVSRADKMDREWNWAVGYVGIFLAEYYLIHQDSEVLEAIKKLVKVTEPRVMGTGSFGYGLLKEDTQRARPCNSAGSVVVWFWALARQCGVRIEKVRWNLGVTYLALSTRADGGIRYNYSAGGYDNASKTANTCIAFNIIGKQGLGEVGKAIKDGRARHVINPDYTWKEPQWARAFKELTSRDITGSHTDFLVKHLKSARENHVTMSLGMLAVPSALSIHKDRSKLREFMDYWKWFIRLSVGPRGEVYYHGNNQGAMGDRQLGPDRMGPVTYAMMLAVGQEKLHIHGGFPAIDGIIYSELSSKMQATYSQIRAKRYKSALRTLTRLAAKRPSKTTEQAGSMLEYVMEIVYHDQAGADEALSSGDHVLAKSLLVDAKKKYGSLATFKLLEADLKTEWDRPENKVHIKRGTEFYRLIKLREVRPKSYRKLMRSFIEADIDGFYSRMPSVDRIREEILRATGR